MTPVKVGRLVGLFIVSEKPSDGVWLDGSLFVRVEEDE
jgi:hypothetical protein